MCSKSLARLILMVFNVAFVIGGAVCLGLGAFVYVKRDDFGGVLARVPVGDEAAKDAVNNPSLLEISAIVLMVVGSLVFLVAFCACCGAMTERTILLDVYSFIVSLMLIAQIGAGVVAVVFNDKVEEKLMDFLTETIKEDYETGIRLDDDKIKLGDESIDIGWDLAQVTLKCCGAHNYSDWNDADKFNRMYSGTYKEQSYDVADAKVPLSCCKVKDPDKYPDELGEIEFEDIEGCLTNPTATNTNLEGCYEEMKDKLEEYGRYLIIAGIVIGLIEIIGVVASCWLCHVIAQERKRL